MVAPTPMTNEKLPIWVGNYVLMGYGEGAVMGVPGHDERDAAFADKYAIAVKTVVTPAAGAQSQAPRPAGAAYSGYGILGNSGKYDGLDYAQAVDAIAAD